MNILNSNQNHAKIKSNNYKKQKNTFQFKIKEIVTLLENSLETLYKNLNTKDHNQVFDRKLIINPHKIQIHKDKIHQIFNPN